MSDRIPATGFVVGSAFLFACGYGALIILGLGAIAVALDTDEPVSPYLQGYAPVALLMSAVAFVLVLLASGLRRDNRIRFLPVLYSSLVALAAYLTGIVAIVVIAWPWAGAVSLKHIGQVIAGPASLVVLISGGLSALSYVATLRWQARNAETKQFAPPED